MNTEHARFLGSHNPAQVKRTVLASFTDVLLLPVTIVPRTVGKAVGAAITTGSSAAVQGIQMLNPQRWGATPTMGQGTFPFARMPSWNANGRDGYVRDFEKGGDGMLFDIGGDDDEEEAEKTKENTPSEKTARCAYRSITTASYCRLTCHRSLSDDFDNHRGVQQHRADFYTIHTSLHTDPSCVGQSRPSALFGYCTRAHPRGS